MSRSFMWILLGSVAVIAIGLGVWFLNDPRDEGEEADEIEFTAMSDESGAYDPDVDPTDFSTEITNPYFSVTVRGTKAWEAAVDGAVERTEVSVSGETKVVMGVTTLVLHDRVTIDGELIEDTRDYLAQDSEGNVWYFGEDVDNYEDGKLVNHDGAWLAGTNGAKPGIWMLANPTVGQTYRQEYDPGEAEDMGEVVAVGETVTVGEKTYTDCVKIRDSSPIEPELNELKSYCAEAGGLVLEEDVLTGHRVERAS